MAARAFVRFRFLVQAGFDITCWIAALAVGTLLRFEFKWDNVSARGFLVVAAVAGLLQLGIGAFVGLYVHRWRYGVLEEIGGLFRSVMLVSILMVVLNVVLFDHAVPTSAIVIASISGFVLMCGGRFLWRMRLDRALRPDISSAARVVVFGAGEGGTQVVRAMLGSRNSPYYPVALLDDDPRVRQLRIKGVPVRGGRNDIVRVARELDATTLLIAIPSATGDLVRELTALADEAGLRTFVLPPVSELFGGGVGVGDIRPVTEEDLLGRRVLHTDVDSVAGYLTGRRVLVTGAGGSIGSELCRQIERFGPESLVMVDRDESGLQAVQISIEGQGLLDRDELVVADIRDAQRMNEVFEHFKPEVVFHAAALKHLTLLERNPAEGFKTNVGGTANLLDVAARHDVDVFVNISTDKAADPTSVLGRTKRLAEQLTADAARRHPGRYLSVRFGNVLGSRGSMLPLFRTQIAAGGPVTVTHPDVTRFFMTIPEACELVIQAGAIGENAHVMVLDMGTPVRIDDVARRLISEGHRDIDIVYTGLRPGEKLAEVLFGDDEFPQRSSHPLISSVIVPPLSPVEVVEFSGEPSYLSAASLPGTEPLDRLN